MHPVLAVRDLTVALPPGGDRAFAIEDVTFQLNAGEILCVVGESGSGKSVLASALMGALAPGLRQISGSLQLKTQEVSGISQVGWQGLRGNRVALIPQEPIAALNPSMRVGAQIEEGLKIHRHLPRQARRNIVIDLLTDMGLADAERVARAYPHQLSGGQCQRICIAMALALGPDVLIADEATTSLDVTTQAQVLNLIVRRRDAHARGVLFITHDLGVVAQIADRVAVMEKGVLVEIGDAARVLSAPQHPYTQALIAAVPSFTPPARTTVADSPARPALECDNLRKSFGRTKALKGVTLEVRRGQSLALVGESGSGKSTLARVLVGLIRADEGRALVGGEDLTQLSGSRLRRGRQRIQMIFQDPVSSLNPRRRVGQMIARAARLSGLSRPAACERALELLQRVGLTAQAYDRFPAAFSGGQRQRVGIARALALNPDILVADESVSALDVSVQAQILQLLRELQAELGLTLVFITHDLRVAAQIGQTIAVMRDGEIVEIGPATQVLTAPTQAYTRALIQAAPGRGVV